jgi:hypothetical protein
MASKEKGTAIVAIAGDFNARMTTAFEVESYGILLRGIPHVLSGYAFVFWNTSSQSRHY